MSTATELPCSSSPGNQATLSELCRSRQSRHFSHIADCAVIRGSPATYARFIMSNQGKKKKSKFVDPMEKSKEQEEAELSALKADIADEKQKKENIEWSNQELEKSVRAMEQNVIQLESGNLEADDSQIKQKYDNQKQLNIQLAEQKRWLEHELEQVKLKIQNEKMNLVPDPFALDWDALSETEMKRLVGQLEKTRNDLRSDLRCVCIIDILLIKDQTDNFIHLAYGITEQNVFHLI